MTNLEDGSFDIREAVPKKEVSHLIKERSFKGLGQKWKFYEAVWSTQLEHLHLTWLLLRIFQLSPDTATMTMMTFSYTTSMLLDYRYQILGLSILCFECSNCALLFVCSEDERFCVTERQYMTHIVCFVSVTAMVHQHYEPHRNMADGPHGPPAPCLSAENSHQDCQGEKQFP